MFDLKLVRGNPEFFDSGYNLQGLKKQLAIKRPQSYVINSNKGKVVENA